MTRPVVALIDCNNFFVSCVRVFKPELNGKPVVALSSNDGCVVARSNEAKALGVPMGAPVFKWRSFFKKHKVIEFSGNFELYGDMSRRITGLLTTITPQIEIYSVDESFLDLSELDIEDYDEWGKQVRRLILKWTGMPVSIGIASSKTLAKLAAEKGKKNPKLGGVLSFVSLNEKEKRVYLKSTPVQDLWGVGRRFAPKLKSRSIHTAADIANMTPQYARQLMGIHGAKMVDELNGVYCLPISKNHTKPKSISVTRTFGYDTKDINVINAALSNFVFKASHKLRLSKQLTSSIGFFMTTNKHKPGYKVISDSYKLSMPTADTGTLIQSATHLLEQHFNPQLSYHRAGVWLYDFSPEDSLQTDLLGCVDPQVHSKNRQRMSALDNVNKRYGKHTVHYASEDLGNAWQPKHQIGVPRYTTRWDELPIIYV